MDLKLENLVLGDDFKLKIIDFDMVLSLLEERLDKYTGAGTENYRAPELKTRKIRSPEKVDIFSCGVILFTLMLGQFPSIEDTTELGGAEQLIYTLQKEESKFWEIHEKIDSETTKFAHANPDFKELVKSMLNIHSAKRPSIKEIKASKWYSGPIY